ncbi:MAG TPA: MmgE/PrpD family protein [Acetobacteraceae bacterium]|nr:MmgE/PrpD family protein [Acetobacteraceae bacterium]
MTAAERFAAHALGVRFADLPEVAREHAAVFILDSLGVGIAGSSVEGGDGLLRVASSWGQPVASVWGRRAKVSAPAAAFLNAWQMHNQEYDCLHEGAVVHALASVLPAALAVAEQCGGVSGAELITAVAVGADIAAGLGLAARAGFRFFRPATAGGFGAVAAAARLLGLDRQRLQAAFAWQLAQVSGTMQAHAEGSAMLPVQVAFNARAAVQSCELAALDFEPAREVFEGPYGYLALFEGAFDLAPVLESLGRDWRIAAFSHKPFPAGRATHGGIEGAMALQAEQGFAWQDVDRVVVSAPPLIVRLVGRALASVPDATSARLCMGYAVAKVLQHGRLDLADFRGEALNDPVTHALAARVETRDDGNPDPNALAPQVVSVRLTDGTTVTWRCETMLANPARRLARDQCLAKFHRCCDFAQVALSPGAPARVVDAVEGLQAVDDVRAIAGLVSGAGSAG